MRKKVPAALVALLLLSPGAAACDREDARDVEEGVNDVEQEVDQLDDDGQDD